MTDRPIRFTICAALAVAVTAGLAIPAADIARTAPLPAGGSLSIEVPFGELRVVGWDRDEVEVSGTYDGDPERLRIESRGDTAAIELSPRRDDRARFDLTIRVPRLGELEIEALSCNLVVDGLVADEVDIEIVDGDVGFDGTVASLAVESVSGEVTIRGTIDELDVESAAGGVTVDAAVRTVAIESAAGDVRVTGAVPVVELAVSTVYGKVRFEGGLAADGELDVETVNGNADLVLDRDTAAEVRIETFNGSIDVRWDGIEGGDRAGYGPGRTRRFELGTGGTARIGVETFNGNCSLRHR